ncbi:MAG: hypothetical protein J6I40_00260 [Mailhella sp.]|nr:hypothetical protein [Mailhella sp.]
MNTEDIVQSVVREVLKRLNKEKKYCVLVLAAREQALEDKVRILLSPYWGGEIDVVFSGECCSGREPKCIILPELTCSGMADLAAGRAGDPYLAEVLQLLLAGQRVDVLDFEYRRYASTASDSLYKLYAAYEKTLRSYGLAAFQEKRPETSKSHEALITSAMIEKASADGVHYLDIPARSIVTPLAAEKADALGVVIRRQS